MIKKIACLFAICGVFLAPAWATSVWTVSASYPGNPGGSQMYVGWFPSGTTFTATMSGVGAGGGASYAIDTSNGSALAFVNTGGGPGQAYYASQTSSALSTGTVVSISVNISASSSGAYGTSSLTSSW